MSMEHLWKDLVLDDSASRNMVEYYKVIEIKGKGLGCIATQDIKRGTLILREAPQISGTQGQMDERSFSIEALLKLSTVTRL